MASRRRLVVVALGVLACLVASSALAATELSPQQRIDIQAEVPRGDTNQSSLGSPAAGDSTTPVAPPTLQQIRQAQHAETVATLSLPKPNIWRDLGDALREVFRLVGFPLLIALGAGLLILAIARLVGGGADGTTNGAQPSLVRRSVRFRRAAHG